MPFLPHLVKSLDKAAPKAIREEKRRAAIGAGRDEWEFTGTVNAVVEGHGAGEYTPDGARPDENVSSGSQTSKDGCLRQPACGCCGEVAHERSPRWNSAVRGYRRRLSILCIG